LSRILWTPLALEDLEGISHYVESKSTLATANRVCRTIYDSVQRLRHFPETGKPGLEDGTREMVVSGLPAYIVVHRLGPHDAVEVLRIWHGAQQRS
jgi:toxin ParE1/3/4